MMSRPMSVAKRAAISLLFVLFGTVCHGEEDACNVHLKCDDCIGKGTGCVWCSDPPPFSGSRCTSPANAVCYSMPEDPVAPPPKILTAKTLGQSVQVSPQNILLHLRTGKPQTFTLSVKLSQGYPLDMYFLMDLSGSQEPDLISLRNLSNSITESLGNISSQYALGFGSFVDKVAYPYASTLQNGDDYLQNHLGRDVSECSNGRDSCEPTYVYRQHLPLTLGDNIKFMEALENVTIRGNVDAPEATLEALLQTVVCDQVGWRDTSLKIVMILTDAGFKTALDGRVGGLLIKNDGECHLESDPEQGAFYDYVRIPEQDFPSIYQVRQKLIENDIITIFAVADNITASDQSANVIYTELANEIGNRRAYYQRIANDSGDIVEVIREAYESVTRDAEVDDIPGLDISITPGLNCNLTAGRKGCANVSLDELVTFDVTVTMPTCLPEKSVSLRLPGFGSVTLQLMPVCECNCTSQPILNHMSCNSSGSLECGICNCSGSHGEECECDRPLSNCPDDCSNRGQCDRCNQICTSCNTEPGVIDEGRVILGSFGETCQCDNSTSGQCSVGKDIKQLCSGRGSCECDSMSCECKCECGTAPDSGLSYYGDDCGCSPDNCYNPLFSGRQCAYNRSATPRIDGNCTCNQCECPPNSIFFNRTCTHENDLCMEFLECARCWPNSCPVNCMTNSLDDLTTEGDSVNCQFSRDGCIVDYQVVLSGQFNSMSQVFVGEERDCPSSDIGNLVWIIPVAIVGGILLLGVLLLIIAKCILMVVDRREYKKFLQDMHTGDFTPHNNPLYVTPETEYKNPLQDLKEQEAEAEAD